MSSISTPSCSVLHWYSQSAILLCPVTRRYFFLIFIVNMAASCISPHLERILRDS